jgi:ubiquinone/menaquinone biosynthesis C-methylase UbiE
MSTKELYNLWSSTYDTVENKTRDLEKFAGQTVLVAIPFENVLEIGAGTGKNTEWLAQKAKHVIAADLSDEMQAVAKEKIKTGNVEFRLADVRKPWNFDSAKFDLITCSLILEHVEDLDFVFENAFAHLNVGGHFYVCELHPFKQYTGSKARFESDEGTQVLECFIHHISDYMDAAQSSGFSIARFDEWFDHNDRTAVPRLISFLFSGNY